jgi:hypothetical protein
MRMFDYNYIHLGFIFIPCPNMTPGGLQEQYLIPNLMPKCKCLSIHSSPPSVRATSPRDPANPAQIVPLPNGNKLPTTGISVETFEEIFFYWTGFVTMLGPQISLLPVPIFGVNICPFYYGIKVILFRNWLPTSSNQICSTLILSPCNPPESSSRSKP